MGRNGRRLALQDKFGPGAAQALVAALDPLPRGLAVIGPDQQLLFQNSRGRDLLRIPDLLAGSDTLDAILIANDAKTVDDDSTAGGRPRRYSSRSQTEHASPSQSTPSARVHRSF